MDKTPADSSLLSIRFPLPTKSHMVSLLTLNVRILRKLKFGIMLKNVPFEKEMFMDPCLDQSFDIQTTTREERSMINAETLRLLGWLFLVFAALCSVFLWTGLEVGSDLWLWGTTGSGVLGLICLGISHYFKVKAVRVIPDDIEQPRAA